MGNIVKNGIDVLLESRGSKLEGIRLGLITNHTGVTHTLQSTVEAMIESGFNIRTLFGAEHGLRGAVQDGATVDHAVDTRTGLRVYSLYGEHLQPTTEMLRGLDALVFDMQDVGVRFYTYLYALAYAMQAAAEHNLGFFVLDRPNPIRGDVVEGAPIEPKMASYVGDYGLPFRTGLTIGEFAHYVNQVNNWQASLEVIPLEGWQRSMWYDATGLPWVMPSPNLPTLDSAIVYPGTVLFEGTNCSEGRGTTRPFELIGAPWLETPRTIEVINQTLTTLGLQGVLLREAYFAPTTSKYQGQLCHGIQLHVSDRDKYEPVKTAIVCLKVIHDLHAEAFEWRPDREASLAIDRLAGTKTLRTMIDAGAPNDELLHSLSRGLEPYLEKRSHNLLYP